MKVRSVVGLLLLSLVLGLGAGCATQAQTGAAAGAGLGALMGQAIGGNTAGTLIGTGVGAGLGYIIGNELDKQQAGQRRQASPTDLGPLPGTSWEVVSVNPRPSRHYRSWKIHFRHDGTALSSKVDQDGVLTEDVERYRVVGSTLIMNQDNYLINARFHLEGNQMFVDTGDKSLVLRRN